jgi:hypothetical protein
VDNQDYVVPPKVKPAPDALGQWWVRDGAWRVVEVRERGGQWHALIPGEAGSVPLDRFTEWAGPLEPITVKDGYALGGEIARTR